MLIIDDEWIDQHFTQISVILPYGPRCTQPVLGRTIDGEVMDMAVRSMIKEDLRGNERFAAGSSRTRDGGTCPPLMEEENLQAVAGRGKYEIKQNI